MEIINENISDLTAGTQETEITANNTAITELTYEQKYENLVKEGYEEYSKDKIKSSSTDARVKVAPKNLAASIKALMTEYGFTRSKSGALYNKEWKNSIHDWLESIFPTLKPTASFVKKYVSIAEEKEKDDEGNVTVVKDVDGNVKYNSTLGEYLVAAGFKGRTVKPKFDTKLEEQKVTLELDTSLDD